MHSRLVLGVFLLSACARALPAAPPPRAQLPSTQAVAEPWLSELDRDNTLVGRVWDVKEGAFVDESAVTARLAQARFVLLGERHDNPDHHRLQARVVARLLKAGRRPAVVFEMLEVAQQGLLDEYLAHSHANIAELGSALGWEHTSWPPFNEYQPIFAAALAGRLAIFAGNLAQSDAKSLVKQGVGALSAERIRELRLDRSFPGPLEASLLDELRASHCGQLPEELLPAMALAQHARDAQMANVLVKAGIDDGAVLISGGGHARLDRGVPYYLALATPGATLTSVVFREVQHGDTDARAYATDDGPFDYVWFTPRHTDEDPCAGFHVPAK